MTHTCFCPTLQHPCWSSLVDLVTLPPSHMGRIFFVNTALQAATIKTLLMAFEIKTFLPLRHKMISNDPFGLCSNISGLRKGSKKIIILPKVPKFWSTPRDLERGQQEVPGRNLSSQCSKVPWMSHKDNSWWLIMYFSSSSQGLERPNKMLQHCEKQ